MLIAVNKRRVTAKNDRYLHVSAFKKKKKSLNLARQQQHINSINLFFLLLWHEFLHWQWLVIDSIEPASLECFMLPPFIILTWTKASLFTSTYENRDEAACESWRFSSPQNNDRLRGCRNLLLLVKWHQTRPLENSASGLVWFKTLGVTVFAGRCGDIASLVFLTPCSLTKKGQLLVFHRFGLSSV